jgi:hypothetical protein
VARTFSGAPSKAELLLCHVPLLEITPKESPNSLTANNCVKFITHEDPNER